MDIGIVGTGSVGRALGGGFGRAGHAVRFGTRDPDRADVRALVEDIKDAAAGSIEWAAACPVLVLAVPAEAVSGVLDGLEYEGVLVDPTNRYPAPGPEPQYTVVSRAAPGARVVKAFNTVGAEVLADPDFDGRPATMLVAGDDVDAKETVLGLATDLGFDPLDAGDADAAAALEHFARLWIRLAIVGPGAATNRTLGREFAFGLLTR